MPATHAASLLLGLLRYPFKHRAPRAEARHVVQGWHVVKDENDDGLERREEGEPPRGHYVPRDPQDTVGDWEVGALHYVCCCKGEHECDAESNAD